MLINFFQDEAQEVAQNVEPFVESLSMMDLIIAGGVASMIIIGILFILLFIAVYIYFERVFAIRAASKWDNNFMSQIRDNVTSGNLQSAKMLCAQRNTPVSRLTEKGISRIGSPL